MHSDVTVIGLGRMGTALARAFLAQGHGTTVWNRSIAKAGPLVELGAYVAPDAAEAVQASPLTVVCVERYHQVNDLLRGTESPGVLEGRTLVNLTWGMGEEAHAMRDSLTLRGARYLDGSIAAYPAQMGTPEAAVMYAGDRLVFDEHEFLLSALGRPRYEGTDIALPNILASAGALFHHVALGAFYEAAAYANHHGVEPRKFLELVADVCMDLCSRSFIDGVDHIERDNYTTDQAACGTHYDACVMSREEMGEIGQRGTLMSAICDLLEPVIVGGNRDLAFSILYKQLRSGN